MMSSEEINDVLDMVSLISIPNVLENDLMLSVDENDALKAIYADVCSMFKQHNYNNVLFYFPNYSHFHHYHQFFI